MHAESAVVGSALMRFRQLLPESRTIEVQALLAEAAARRRAHGDRPHVAVNFINSVDGRATVDGRSGGLGDSGDRAMFHGLRESFDAVTAGTATLQTEGYGRILGQAERRERRLAQGRSAEPLACVLTRSGFVPEIPLLAEPEARVAIFTGAELKPAGWAAQVTIREIAEGEPLIPGALRFLRTEFEIESLLCEGGPTLFTALLDAGVVDELFLTLAPKLVGGSGPLITRRSELPALFPMQLGWLLERDGAVFLRYAVGVKAPGVGQ